MPSYLWTGADGGDWSDPANWSPSGVPGAADQAVVNLAGSYTIALDVAEIGSLMLNAVGATVTPTGTLKLDGTLDVKAGTLTVGQTIQGGTLIADGGTIAYTGGTLDGVTLSGPLDLSANGARLTIADGIGFTGPGPGQILDTGAGSALIFSGTQTLDNVAITLGSTSGNADLSVGSLTLDANSSLTINNNGTVFYSNLDNRGTISDAGAALSSYQTSSIENEGTLSIGSGPESRTLFPQLINTGTLDVSDTVLFVGNLVNTGRITVSQGSDFEPDVAGSNTGTITVDSTSTLEIRGNETLAQLGIIDNQGGTVLVGGTLDLAGSTVDITAGSPASNGFRLDDGTIENGTIETDGTGIHYSRNAMLSGVTIDGTLDVNGGSNAILSIENGLAFTGTTLGQIIDTGGNVLQFEGDETLHNVDITLSGSLDFTGKLTLDTGSTVTGDGDLTSTTIFGLGSGNGVLDNQGTITGSFSSASGTIENEGSFFIDSGSSRITNLTNTGLLDISRATSSATILTLANAGTVQIANGGNLSVSAGPGDRSNIGQFSSTGTVQISGYGTLILQDGASALGTVSFLDQTGTLVLTHLDPSQQFHQLGTTGTLNLFQSGDVLDLGLNIDHQPFGPPSPGPYSISHSGNTLTVDEGSTVFDSFTLTGQDYTNATFTLTGDIVTTDAPCFCAGTLILTDRGGRAVETLEIGDVVVTRQDGIETLLPVRWIGSRRVVPARHHEPEHVDPIRIARDAIGPGLPARDLFVSPDHALHLDGMLIQARQLVNHMTITRNSGRATVTYYHVELDRHAILIADGLPCESYLDSGNRDQFDTAGIVVLLYDAAVDDRPPQPCAPMVTAAALVQPVWQRLAERARAAGHAEPVPELEPDSIPWLETEQGVTLTLNLDHDRLSVVLPPGCLRVRLCSHSDLPTTLAPWSDDRRRLGVAISAVTLRQGNWRQELDLAELDPDAGWWPLETADGLAWRWTDGEGWIALPEPALAIEIRLHAVMPMPVSGVGPACAKAG